MPIKQLLNKGHQSINISISEIRYNEDADAISIIRVIRSLLKNGHQLVK